MASSSLRTSTMRQYNQTFKSLVDAVAGAQKVMKDTDAQVEKGEAEDVRDDPMYQEMSSRLQIAALSNSVSLGRWPMGRRRVSVLLEQFYVHAMPCCVPRP